MHQRYKNKGLVILAVDIGETQAKVKQFVKETRRSFLTLVDLHNQVARKYNVTGHPHTVLINPRGELLGLALGPREWVGTASLSYFEYILNQARAGT